MAHANALRILFVEDMPSDAEIAKRMIRKSGLEFSSQRVDTEDGFLEALGTFKPDIVISDYMMPTFNGMQALKLSLEWDATVPVIILTGSMNEDTAVECLKTGASNYVIKENIARLPFAVGQALEQKKLRVARDAAERELRSSDERLKLALVTTRTGVWEWNAQTNVVYWSPECYNIVGTDSMEKTFEGFLKFVHPDDMVRFNTAVQQSLTDRTVFLCEFRIINPRGEILWLANNGRAEYDTNGRPARMIGTVRDITQRKQSEDSLKFFRTLVDNSADAIEVIDPATGRFIEANEKAWQSLGYSREEFLFLKVADIDPTAKLPLDKGFLNLLTTKGSARIEGTHRRKDGTEFPVEVNLRLVCLDKEYIVSSSRDITERRQMEEAILYEQSLLKALMDNTPDHLYFKDTQSRFLKISRSQANHFGLADPVQAQGKSDFEFFSEEHARLALKNEQEIVESGISIVGVEEKETWPDGHETWVSTTKVPLQDAQGQIIGTFGISRDITQRRRAEDTLQKQKQQLEEAQRIGHIGNWEFDIATNTATWSDEMYRILGRDRNSSALTLQGFMELPHPDDRARVHGIVQKSIQMHEPTDMDFRILTPNGGLRWIHANSTVMVDNEGKPIRIFGTCQDVTERKKTEDLLQMQKRSLEEAQRIGHIGNWEWDVISNTTTWSNEMYKVFGRDRDAFEFTLDAFMDAPHPGDRAMVRGIVQRSFETHEPTEFDFRIVTPSGELRWIHEISSLEVDPSGKPLRVFGTCQDITERKKAEKSGMLLTAALESAANGVTITDNKGNIVWVNKAFAQMTGYAAQEVIGQNPRILKSGKQDGAFYSELWETISGGTVWRGEIINRKKDGTLYNDETMITPLKNANDEITNYIAIKQDVSERKRSEVILKESEEKYKNLFERNLAATFVSTPSGVVLDCNPAYLNLFGFESPEKALSTNMGLLYGDPRNREQLLTTLQAHENVENMKIRMVRTDGSPLYVIANVVGKFDDQGRLIQKTGYLIDDTKRHRLETELIQSQKLESLGILAGGIAHDFNNILGILMGHVSLLDRIQDNPELHRTSLDAIDTALKRGTGLVRQLLTFARKSDVSFEPLLVNDTVKELIRLLRETLPRTIEIVAELNPKLPAIVADAGQLHQVMLNLCVNARDAMHAGGRITIQTKLADGLVVRQRFPNALAGQYVSIEVRDSGTGMDDATKSRIFEPFFTTKESGKGTGLGLAVVFGVVQTHKGHIDVESEIGKGTTFRIYLPVEIAPNAERKKSMVSFEDSRGGTETILFVEDEPLLYETAKISLVGKGYKVLYAKDGLEALDEFRKHFKEIHLVLTDMDLPKLGGAKLVEALLQISPKLKIIFASGYLEPNVKSEVLKSGAKAFLAKPYDHVSMLATVREVLDVKE